MERPWLARPRYSLCALASQPGTLLTKDALLDAVWGHQFVSESVLKTAISDLRTALGDSPREPRFIEIRDGTAQFVPIRDPASYWPLALAAGVGAWLTLRGLRSLWS